MAKQPGKFEAIPEEYQTLAQELYESWGNGMADDECGDCQMNGFAAARFEDENVCAIMVEDDRGFVTIEVFDSADDIETRWNELLEASADDSDSADDSEQL